MLLPASARTAPPAADASPLAVTGQRRLLVLDDEPYLRDIVTELLTSLGYEVTAVGGGDEVVARFRAAHGTNQAFDVAILDLTIPGGMGGIETLRRLREIDADVKAIASSGYSDDPVIARPVHYGFAGGLMRPYTMADLGALLGRVLT